MSNRAFAFFAFAWFGFGLIVGLFIGQLQGEQWERDRAVRMGTGHYTVNPKTGFVWFQYGPKP